MTDRASRLFRSFGLQRGVIVGSNDQLGFPA